MRNILILIEYDGTNYNGWQRQPNAASVQEEIEKAIYKITKKQTDIYGSGRTDAKVHALGQVANFHTDSTIPTEKFAVALNTNLPDDIVILNSIEVPEEFHSRYSAKVKTYRYRVLNTPVRRPIERNYAYHVREDLDLDIIKTMAKLLIGEHDFKAFSSSGSSVKTTIRTIYDIKITKENDIIEFEFTGNGFLYNMVRIIVGTLIELGKKSTRYDIQKALMTGDRGFAGPTAPPQGLFLKKVSYNLDIKS